MQISVDFTPSSQLPSHFLVSHLWVPDLAFTQVSASQYKAFFLTQIWAAAIWWSRDLLLCLCLYLMTRIGRYGTLVGNIGCSATTFKYKS